MNVLVLPPFNAAQKSVLEAGAPGATFVYSDYRSATDEQVAAADVIVGNLSPKRLGKAARLQLLQLNSAGYDNYAAAETLPRGGAYAARWARTARRFQNTSSLCSSP